MESAIRLRQWSVPAILAVVGGGIGRMPVKDWQRTTRFYFFEL
jgi:hypothetical protein